MKAGLLQLVLFAACAAATLPAHAQHDPELGGGGLSCGKYLQLRRAGDAQTVALANVHSWTQGFISGMNVAVLDARIEAGEKDARLFPQPTPESIGAHLEKYCAENASKEVVTAATALWTSMRKAQLGL
jgi:hypothetical protein